jgi:hypothetical protein
MGKPDPKSEKRLADTLASVLRSVPVRVALLAEAAALDAGFAPRFFALGDVARAQGNLAAARTFYGIAFQRYPQDIAARLDLAELDIAEGQATQADSCAAPIGSLAKWPPCRRARFELGPADVASHLRRYVEARGRVEEALRHW